MTAPVARSLPSARPGDRRAARPDSRTRRLGLGALSASLMLALAVVPMTAPMAMARDLGIPATPVPLRFNDVPLSEVLTSTLARVRVQAWVSPQLNSRIVMALEPVSARDFVAQLVSNYKLIVYNDGQRLYFYPASDVRTETLETVAPTEVARQLAARAGNGNSVRTARGRVTVTGVAPFIAEARAIASRVQAPESARPARSARTRPGSEMVAADGGAALVAAPGQPALSGTGGGPIISPLLPTPSQQTGRAPMSMQQQERLRALTMAGMPVEAQQAGPLSSMLIHAASPASRMEVRTFTLRWASAADRRTPSGEQVMPGVARKVADAQGYDFRQTQIESRQTVSAVPASDGTDANTFIINNAPPADAQVRTRETVDLMPKISADAATNQIIVTALPADMPRISALIEQWDVPSPQIELTISVVDVYSEQLEKQGVNLASGLDALVGIFGGSIFGETGFGVGILAAASDVAAGLGELGGQGASRIVEQKTGLFTPGQLDYLRDINALRVSRGGTRGGLDSLEAGFNLRVTPHLRGDAVSGRIVNLDMQLENSRFTGESLKSIPEKASTEFSTSLQIPHGQSMVMVSQSKDVQYTSKDKAAILGDIPLLGWLFKERRNGAMQVRQLMIVTPRVVTHGRGVTPPGRTGRKSLDDLVRERTVAATGRN